MIFGLLIRQALGKSELPVDAPHLELAKTECNFIIEDLHYKVKADYRQSRGTINTVSGAEEYVLNKFVDSIVPNTLQGPSTNPRYFDYLNPTEFFRRIRIHSQTSGRPHYYTFGEMVGYDAQLNVAAKIRVNSSLSSKLTGTINIFAGSDKVTSSTDVFTLNDVGLRLRKGSDAKTYKIVKYVGPREIYLAEKYRGASETGASYVIGDVGVHVNIMGFVGGQITSEDVELNGSNYITTTKTFNSLVSISKSDRTGGNITVQNEGQTQTVGVLAPGETEIERQTILFWPRPNGEEALTYRFFIKHPFLWLDTDRILIPNKWHRLICYKLEKRLREAFGKEVPQGLFDDIIDAQTQFENEAEDLSASDLVPGDERRLGDQHYFDKLDIYDL